MSDVVSDKPQRKAMFLSATALDNLAATAAIRATETDAVEEALALLAQRDAQRVAMDNFIAWATIEWGEPTEAEQERADQIWLGR